MRFVYIRIPVDKISDRATHVPVRGDVAHAIREKNGDLTVCVGTHEQLQAVIDGPVDGYLLQADGG